MRQALIQTANRRTAVVGKFPFAVVVVTGLWNLSEIPLDSTDTPYQITLFLKIALAIVSGAAVVARAAAAAALHLHQQQALGLVQQQIDFEWDGQLGFDIAAPGGGYVLASDHSLHDGIPVENITTMFKVGAEYGRAFYAERGQEKTPDLRV